MHIWVIIRTALRGLWANKLRSVLTMLGIIIGVGAVITMLALVQGIREGFERRLRNRGTNVLVVRPNYRRRRGVRAALRQNLTVKDAAALLTQIPMIEALSPTVQGSLQFRRGNRNHSTTVIGTSADHPRVLNYTVEPGGRYFTPAEVLGRAKVCVLGPEVVKKLFPRGQAVGERIRIKGVEFLVIGTMKPKGAAGWSNPDDQAYVPLPTAMKRLFGRRHINYIQILVRDVKKMKQAQLEVEAMLRRRHPPTGDGADDFMVRNQAEQLEMFSEAMMMLSLLFGGIAAVSLLVGGIGIMNIMLVSVTERTREIGIRKAVGARRRDIMKQFLGESVVLSVFGGGLGVTLGFAGSFALEKLMQRAMDVNTSVTLSSVLLAFGFAAAVGVIFGLYPAWKASRLNPIEALRYE